MKIYSQKSLNTNFSDLEKIYKLCKQVREDLLILYPDELDYIGEPIRFFESDYTCACALASYMVKRAAKKLHGIHLDLVCNSIHAFCLYNKNIVCDPTFSQFDIKQPIYIGEGTKDYHFLSCLKNTRESYRDFNEVWPDEQNPYFYDNKYKVERWLKRL